MKYSAILLAIFAGTPALAHPGHIIEVAGHDHVLAGVAIGAAIAAGLWGALKGKDKESAKNEADDADFDDLQEA